MSMNDPYAPSFNPPPANPTTRRSPIHLIAGVLLVGFGMLVLGGVICVAGVWYVAKNVDRFLVGLGREALVAMVQEAEIPEAEKNEVVAQIDRVVSAYKERKIDQADLQKALEQLEESPAVKVLALSGTSAFLEDSGLSDEEIASGQRTLQRVQRGVYEGQLNEDDVYRTLAGNRMPLPDGDAEENEDQAVHDQLTLVAQNGGRTADDVRESVTKLKVMADNAHIPDEPFQLDIGDEVKKLVDKLLEGKEKQ
jgi:hypothetical protein